MVLDDPHTCTQVTEVTWNENGNTPLEGGFDFGPGDHTFTLSLTGVYYYICLPHINMGMKGRIVVEEGTGVAETAPLPMLRLMPNPAVDRVQLVGAPTQGTRMAVYDVNGRLVSEQPLWNSATLDVSALDPGTYTVMLKGPDSAVIVRERLVVTR